MLTTAGNLSRNTTPMMSSYRRIITFTSTHPRMNFSLKTKTITTTSDKKVLQPARDLGSRAKTILSTAPYNTLHVLVNIGDEAGCLVR